MVHVRNYKRRDGTKVVEHSRSKAEISKMVYDAPSESHATKEKSFEELTKTKGVGNWKKLWDEREEIIFFNKKLTSIHLKIYKIGNGDWDIDRWLGNASFPLVGTRITSLGNGFGSKEKALIWASKYMRKHPNG